MQSPMKTVPSLFLAFTLLFSAVSCRAVDPVTSSPNATPAATAQVIYLVRHAEKALQGDNPPLTRAGERRAQSLAVRLANAAIQSIYSTDYQRTLRTATPTATRLQLPIRRYDPRALEKFAQQLLNQPGSTLVVGHSNTTPALVEMLGGRRGSPIIEASEYDRLYVLRISQGATVSTQILRYGD